MSVMGNRHACNFEGVKGILNGLINQVISINLMTLVYRSYTFSAKWTARKTLVNGWTQPPLSSYKKMLFLLYLQTSKAAAVFSLNGNMDAMIFFLCCMMLKFPLSRHTVVCRAAQENGARANGSEYINRNNKVAIFTHS